MSTRLRLCAVTLLILIAALAAAVKLNISVNGTKVGSGDFSVKKLPNGGIRTLSVMKISAQGFSATITSSGDYDKKGRPMKESSITKTSAGTRKVEVEYTKTSARVKTTQSGKTTTKTVKYPKGKNLNQASQFWFSRDIPKVGAVDKTVHLDLDTLIWKDQTETYTGKETIKVGGKSYATHKITHKEGVMWVDSKGLPIKMEITEQGSKLLFERA